jgi:hypothetical protein
MPIPPNAFADLSGLAAMHRMVADLLDGAEDPKVDGAAVRTMCRLSEQKLQQLAEAELIRICAA